MSSRAFVVHIGRHKTGSTALQLFLNRNRDALAKIGYFFPAPLELHANLAVQLMYEQGSVLPPDISHRFPWLNGGGDRPMELLKKQLVSSDAPSVILSSEGYCNVHPSAMAKYFPANQSSIIVYIRDQLEYLLSAYAQAIQETKRTYSFEEFEKNEYLAYTVFLDQWHDLYGKNLCIRLYEKDQLVAGDIRRDFLASLNIKEEDGFIFPAVHANPSIGGPLLEFKLLLNKLSSWPVEKLMPATYRHLGILAGENERYRKKLQISARLTEKIRAKYRLINQEVQKKYFPSLTGGIFEHRVDSLKSEDTCLTVEDFDFIIHYFNQHEPQFVQEHYALLKNAIATKSLFQ